MLNKRPSSRVLLVFEARSPKQRAHAEALFFLTLMSLPAFEPDLSIVFNLEGRPVAGLLQLRLNVKLFHLDWIHYF
jgi:hypothetical protein